MEKSPEQKQKDVFALMEKHRQEMAAYLQQQAEFEGRIELLRERLRVLRIEMEAIRDTRLSLDQYKKQLEWQQRMYGKRFFTPLDK